MAGSSTRLFQFNQNYCQVIGIKSPKSNENLYKCKSIRFIFVIFETIFAIALLAFLLYDAESMGEYGITFHIFNTAIAVVFFYFIMISKMNDILLFTENCEKFIKKSKFNVFTNNSHFSFSFHFNATGENKAAAYQEFNVKIDRLCELLSLSVFSSILLLALFPLFYTGVSYCFLDLGSESFFSYPPTELVFH